MPKRPLAYETGKTESQYARDITLPANGQAEFIAPFDSDFWFVNNSGTAVTIQKAGKSVLPLANRAVVKDFMREAEGVVIVGTAGLVISVYDSFDVKPIPTGSDVLGAVTISGSPFIASGGTSGGQPVTKTTAAVANDNAVVVRWSVQQVSFQAGSTLGLVTAGTGVTTASPQTTTDTAVIIGSGTGIRAIRNTGGFQCRLGGSDVTQGTKGFLLNTSPGTVDLPSLIVFGGAPVACYVVSEVAGNPTTVEWC